MYRCSAVTCHLHFWQNGRATGTDTEIKVSTEKVDPGEFFNFFYLAAPAGFRTRDLSIATQAL